MQKCCLTLKSEEKIEKILKRLISDYELDEDQEQKLRYFADCVDGMNLDDSDIEHLITSAIDAFLQ